MEKTATVYSDIVFGTFRKPSCRPLKTGGNVVLAISAARSLDVEEF
jgi:hypothetical protein